MASIKISNTTVETNLANIEGLVGYRTNPNTQGLETVQITGDYIGGPDPNAPQQGFISTKPFTVYEDEANIQEFPGNSNRSIVSYSGIETYGNLEVFTQTGIASFIGQSNTVLKSNEGDVTIEGGATSSNPANGKVTIKSGGVTSVHVQPGGLFDVDSGGAIQLHANTGTSEFYSKTVAGISQANLKIYTIGGATNKGHIEILSGGSHADSKGIVLKSATDIQVDLHSIGNGNTPIIGQALIAKDTDGNIEFGDGVVLSQTAAGVPNSGLKYSTFGNNGLQVNGITTRGIKVTTSQDSGVQIDFAGVTTTANKASIGAPMLDVITAANAEDARAAIGAIDSDDIGTYFKTSPTPFTLEFGPKDPGGTGGEVIASSSLSIANGSGIAITTTVTGTGNKNGDITIATDPYDAGGLGFQTITGKSKLSLDLTQLGDASTIPGAGVGKVGILMNAAGQVDGHKLEFKNTSSDPTTPAVELVTAPQSPDIVCIVNSNANLQSMDNGKAYVVPFDTYGATPNGGYYVFEDADTDVAIDWNSYVEIQNDGKYMINAKVGMYNAEKGGATTPSLTVWVEVSDGTPATLGDVNAPYDLTVHCIGSCQVNRDQNGFAVVSGSTMLNLLEGDCIRVIVRSDSFGYGLNQGDRPYFVYNDIDVGNGNSATGHRPQLEIYKIN